MSGESTVCSNCGKAKFACHCEFRPEYLPPDGQERCTNCHGPQDRCVSAPSPSAELSLTVEHTDIRRPTIIVDGPVPSQLDQDVLIELLEHELSTDCSTTATGEISIAHVERETVADHFRLLGYTIVESTDGGDRTDTVRVNGDTALYTTQTEGGDHAPATQPTPERSVDSGVDQSTATFRPSRCPACERAFSDRDDIPTFCPACGIEL